MPLDETPLTPDWWLIRLGRRMQWRKPELDRWWRFYTGDHPLPELPKKATDAFREFQRKSRTNFCQPVADASVHRLTVLGITDGQGNPDADALRWWQANRLDSGQKRLYRTVMAQARGYVMVGPHPTRTEANGPARAAALVQLAQDMPPAVLAPMLGLHTNTLVKWRRRAATDWTAYLEARSTSRAPGDARPGPDGLAVAPLRSFSRSGAIF